MSDQTISSIEKLLLRDLSQLELEISRYPDDASIWSIPPGISNSGGTLTLHLCGNLQYYIGALLGETGYVRNRPREFSDRGLPARQLVEEIGRARAAVTRGLSRLTADDLERTYPENVFHDPMTIRHFLIHLCVHLGYHLGQVNYHRRLTTNPAASGN